MRVPTTVQAKAQTTPQSQKTVDHFLIFPSQGDKEDEHNNIIIKMTDDRDILSKPNKPI